MNKPHVKALRYRAVPGNNVDYEKAGPISIETDEFTMHLDAGGAVFAMKRHYSSAEPARKIVDEYLQAWEIMVGLEHDPGDLHFKFQNAEIIALDPPFPGSSILNLQAHITAQSFIPHVVLHVSRGRYPSPPSNFVLSPDVETMFVRFKAYRQDRESLTSMAYMCLTVIETSAHGRKEASKKYSVDFPVLDTLGRLCTTKGDASEARKAPKDGNYSPLSQAEKEWIVAVIKALIFRVGVWAYDPQADLPKLMMEDFPPLKD